jgi:hypothetical protein
MYGIQEDACNSTLRRSKHCNVWSDGPVIVFSVKSDLATKKVNYYMRQVNISRKILTV